MATYIGLLLGLAWPAALVFCLLWLVVAALIRYSSLAGLVASAATPVALWLHRRSARGTALRAPHRDPVDQAHGEYRAARSPAPSRKSAPATERSLSATRASFRRAAGRLAASDPHRECRAPHLPHPDQPFRRRRARARAAARSRAPRRRSAARICSREEAEREIAAARCWASASWRWASPTIPRGCATIDDAPPLLAVRGNLAALEPADDRHGRRAQRLGGRPQARRAACARSRRSRLVIVSGLARGIDAAAHRGSLATGTVAVLAGGPTASIRPNMRARRRDRAAKAPPSPKCRSDGSRGRAISRAATASSRVSRSASSWSKRRGAPAR